MSFIAKAPLNQDGFWILQKYIYPQPMLSALHNILQDAIGLGRPPLAYLFQYVYFYALTKLSILFHVDFSFLNWISVSLLICASLTVISWLLAKLTNVDKERIFIIISILISCIMLSNSSYYHDASIIFSIFSWGFSLVPIEIFFFLLLYKKTKLIQYYVTSLILMLVLTFVSESQFPAIIVLLVLAIQLGIPTKMHLRLRALCAIIVLAVLTSIAYWILQILNGSAMPGYTGSRLSLHPGRIASTFVTQTSLSVPPISQFRSIFENWHVNGVFNPNLPIQGFGLRSFILALFLFLVVQITLKMNSTIPRNQFELSNFFRRSSGIYRLDVLHLLLFISLFPTLTFSLSMKYQEEVPALLTTYVGYPTILTVLAILLSGVYWSIQNKSNAKILSTGVALLSAITLMVNISVSTQSHNRFIGIDRIQKAVVKMKSNSTLITCIDLRDVTSENYANLGQVDLVYLSKTFHLNC